MKLSHFGKRRDIIAVFQIGCLSLSFGLDKNIGPEPSESFTSLDIVPTLFSFTLHTFA